MPRTRFAQFDGPRRRSPRIGVTPGPSAAIFFISWALIVAAGVITQANLLFWGIGLMAGVLVVSAALPWRVVRALRVERLGMTHGVAGERLTIRYHVTHRGKLPAFAVTLTELWGRGGRGWRKAGPIAERPPRLRFPPTGWVMHLAPGQRLQAEAPTWPLRRGRLAFERVRLATSFPFGVLKLHADLPLPGEVRVYPHIYRVRRGVIDGISDLNRPGPIGSQQPGGVEEFFGLREYREGDKPRQIDWKRSSRTGRLVTREYTRPGPPRIDMVLDLTVPDDLEPPEADGDAPWEQDPFERAVSLAASVVCEAHLLGYELGMTVYGADCPAFPARHNPAHRARLLDALATLRPVDSDATPPVGRATLIVWTGRGSASPEQTRRRAAGTATVLGAADLHRYVEPGSGRRLLTETARAIETRPARRMHRVRRAGEAGDEVKPGAAPGAGSGASAEAGVSR